MRQINIAINIVGFFALCLLLSACEGEEAVLPGSKVKLPIVYAQSYQDSVEGYFLVQQNRDSSYYADDSTIKGSLNHIVSAEFYDTYGASVSAGIVKFNTTVLGTPDGGNLYSTPGDIYVSGSSPTYTSQFVGNYDKYTTTGSGSWPAITDSMRSPVGQMIVTSPNVGQQLSISSPITISWSGSGDTNCKVKLVLHDTVSAVTYLDNDDGSYTFSTSQISALGGRGYLMVNKYRYKVDSVYDGTRFRRYGIVCVTSQRKNIFFVP